MIQIQVNIQVYEGRTRLDLWQLSREDADESERKLADAFEELFASVASQLGPVVRNGVETFEMSAERVDALLRDAGLDSDEVRRHGREFVAAELAALRKWIETAKITTGPVWRQVYHGQILEKGLTNGDYFFELVAKTAKEAGISPSDISPHRAFRATPITLALLSGRPFVETMSKARHLSLSATSSYIDRSAIDQHEVGRSIYKSRS